MATFKHYCTCGGYAWSVNGRDPADPHMTWCPQREEYKEWWDATHGGKCGCIENQLTEDPKEI